MKNKEIVTAELTAPLEVTQTIMTPFNIQGSWLTWMLRHLWVEGNEVKAIKIWCVSFPDYRQEKI